MAEVAAAIKTRMKNKNPKNAPKGMSAKTAGKMEKIKPGPAVGSKPRAKTAGRMAQPDKIAARESSPTTMPVSLTMLVSFSDSCHR